MLYTAKSKNIRAKGHVFHILNTVWNIFKRSFEKQWFFSPLWNLSKKRPNSNYEKITEK